MSRAILAALVLFALLACRGAASNKPHQTAQAEPAVQAVPKPLPGSDFLTRVHDQVARDSVAQYEIAKKSDDKIQVCVQAGMVAAAYLQAKDEKNFLAWKATEKGDCAAAGMPK